MLRRSFLGVLAPAGVYAAVERCGCNPVVAATLEPRECSLTKEALRPQSGDVFFLKDASPRKPNRLLALPTRLQPEVMQELKHLTTAERHQLWRSAIGKSKELWGDDWGVAYNGVKVRTQCHLHLHIGKLLHGVDSGQAIFVGRLEEIPVPHDGSGLWVHAVGGRLKVHLNEQTCETVLLR